MTERKKRGARGSVSMRLRVPSRLLDLIDRAAEATNRTRAEFFIEAALDHAEELLFERRRSILDGFRFDAFLHALDHPTPPNEKLRALMKKPLPWGS